MKDPLKQCVSRAKRALGWAPPEGVLYSVTIFPKMPGGPEVSASMSQCAVQVVVDLDPSRSWREDRDRLEQAALKLDREHTEFHRRLDAKLAAARNLKGGDGC